MRGHRISVIVIAVAAVTVGCSNGSRTGTPPPAASAALTVTEPPSSSTLPTPDATPDATASASRVPSATASEEPSGMVGHAHPVAVSIEGFAFSPASVEVAAGQTVAWSNEDGEPHTVRAEDGSISSPIISGEPFEWKAEGRPGTEIAYICSVHPSMKGTITIATDEGSVAP